MEPLKPAPPPSLAGAAEVERIADGVLALEEESSAERVEPLGRCQTPLKLASQTAAGVCWGEAEGLP